MSGANIVITLLLLGLQSVQTGEQWGQVLKNERITVEVEKALYGSRRFNNSTFYSQPSELEINSEWRSCGHRQ